MQTILLVDDSPVARAMMKRFIRAYGTYTVLEADNGAEALRLYSANDPVITFLDLTMPTVSGYEVLEKIHRTDQNAYIVVVTADRQRETARRVRRLGARHVLHKPPDEQSMKRIIREAEGAYDGVR